MTVTKCGYSVLCICDDEKEIIALLNENDLTQASDTEEESPNADHIAETNKGTTRTRLREKKSIVTDSKNSRRKKKPRST